MSLIDRAREFALARHGDQKYGTEPYEVHLQSVVNVVGQWTEWFDLAAGDISDLLAAAWNHDVLEDTDTSFEELASVIGNTGAYFVSLVTNEKGANRTERHLKTWPRIRSNRGATLLKMADRFANHLQQLRQESSLGVMYAKEYPLFKFAFYSSQFLDAWKGLDMQYLALCEKFKIPPMKGLTSF